MAGNILNIGKTGLFAAQAGMATTGNNIANASVAGYSRQRVLQASGPTQNIGVGFIGSGTQVTDIQRFSDPFLNNQVRAAATSLSSYNAYNAQISQVDNLLSDNTSGLSPVLQNFFKGIQDLASNPSTPAARDAVLSAASTLASRFQGMNDRLQEIRDGVNTQIETNVSVINSYASQIAKLNDQIAAASSRGQGMPNDLLDARDQLVLELNTKVKATVVAGDNNSITVSIGSGQPLVVGKKAYELATTTSPTDPGRVQVGYVTNGKIMPLGEKALTGGELGGLLEFRAGALDRAQNSLGRIAITIAHTFNDQHKLGQDLAGNPGADFFKEAPVGVAASRDNALSSTAVVGGSISDPTKLTASDYKVDFNGSNYTVTRMSDNQQTVINPYPQTVPQTIDGVDFAISGASTSGDSFLVRPTINGAAQFGVAITDRTKIAAASPIVTNTPTTNTGTGAMGPSSVDANYLTPGNKLTAPVTLTFNSATGGLSGFPAGQAVTVTNNGSSTVYPAGTNPIPFTAGASYSFGGVKLSLSGAPGNGDKFTVGPNINGVGDNTNARALGALQTKPILDGGSATYQSSYAEMVSFVGNKTREVQVNGKAGAALLLQAQTAQQTVSGVNLDEEATNLLKYQQAYQASGKVMQVASTLFDTLLSLGS